ncbi:MAG: hypothetical protein ACE5R6_17385 [Candidatus Heimdallarchaeota archaeon]
MLLLCELRIPLYYIGAILEHQDISTLATTIRRCFELLSLGTAVCVTAVLMATDDRVLIDGEDVVAAAGS